MAMWARQRARRRRRAAAAVLAACGSALAVLGWLVVRQRPWPGGWPAWWLPALACALGATALVVRPLDDPDRWARGAEGERATAELLEVLSRRRWAVFHDVGRPGSRANVDHLVIGPTGAWVVDTKSYRARLRVRRRSVMAGTAELPTGPVRYEAEQVADLLGCPVRALVAVHGQGLPARGRVRDGVRIVPAHRLVRQLRRGRWLRRRLSRRDVRRLAGDALRRLGPASPR